MLPQDNHRDPISSLLMILIVLMVFLLVGMTIAASHVLAMPYPFS
ncbi:MAG: hypothetical protein M5U01_41235 [Ardenticatenaceae bacterium]|nr:hypothetical protein [Ardenticatenaceae bacterium]